MLKVTREDDAEYLKSLAAVRKKAADSVHEFICGGPVVVPAPEKPVTVAPLAVPALPPASIVPAKPRPGSYEEFLAENAARLRLPGMVRGLGGCAVEASAINPFTGKPYSEDPAPSEPSHDCESDTPDQNFGEYMEEINSKEAKSGE